VTDPERMVCEYENCKVLLVDKKISTARDIIGILEAAIRCVGVGGWGSVGLGGLMGV
jgi:chaperonin GroEL (HSP60 family)